jgi:hypothetical protein
VINKSDGADGPGEGYDFLLQLALSTGGTLYAQQGLSNEGTGAWFELDPTSGDIVADLFTPEATFTDVSSGVEFEEPVYEEETAWGFGGYEFPGNSWAQWIKYFAGGIPQ